MTVRGCCCRRRPHSQHNRRTQCSRMQRIRSCLRCLWVRFCCTGHVENNAATASTNVLSRAESLELTQHSRSPSIPLLAIVTETDIQCQSTAVFEDDHNKDISHSTEELCSRSSVERVQSVSNLVNISENPEDRVSIMELQTDMDNSSTFTDIKLGSSADRSGAEDLDTAVASSSMENKVGVSKLELHIEENTEEVAVDSSVHKANGDEVSSSVAFCSGAEMAQGAGATATCDIVSVGGSSSTIDGQLQCQGLEEFCEQEEEAQKEENEDKTDEMRPESASDTETDQKRDLGEADCSEELLHTDSAGERASEQNKTKSTNDIHFDSLAEVSGVTEFVGNPSASPRLLQVITWMRDPCLEKCTEQFGLSVSVMYFALIRRAQRKEVEVSLSTELILDDYFQVMDQRNSDPQFASRFAGLAPALDEGLPDRCEAAQQLLSAELMCCVLCNVAVADTIFLPCGHFCCCRPCLSLLLPPTSLGPLFCPVCKLPASETHNVFL